MTLNNLKTYENYEKFVLILAVINLLIVMLLSSSFSPFIDPDAISYIESARHLKEGKGLTTFADIEQVQNDYAPLILFPAGYPVMIYGLSLLGLDPVTAATRIPQLCFIVLPYLLFYVLRFIGGNYFAFLVTAATVYMQATIIWSFLAMSDIPFLTLTLLSFWILFKSFEKIKSIENPMGYFVVSGIIAGFAIAVRNVGYSIPLAVLAGLTIGAAYRLILWKEYYRALLGYGIGVVVGYGPFLLRNLVVFHTWQPYQLPLSQRAITDNIKDYLFALEKSFVGSFGEYTGVMFILVAALSGITLFSFFNQKHFVRIRKESPEKIVGALILTFYLIFGSVVIVWARTKYQWGENINPRHLLQYNWIFLAMLGAIIAYFMQYSSRYTRFNFKCLAVIGLVFFLFFQWQVLLWEFQYGQPRELYRLKYLRTVSQSLQNFPEETLVVSTPWPALRILSGKPIRQMYTEISPAELIASVCPSRPLAVILERRHINVRKYTTWKDAIENNVTTGFQAITDNSAFLVLFHPKLQEGRGAGESRQ